MRSPNRLTFECQETEKTHEGYRQVWGAATIDRVLELAGLRFGRSLIEIAITIFPWTRITAYGIKIAQQTSLPSIRTCLSK